MGQLVFEMNLYLGVVALCNLIARPERICMELIFEVKKIYLIISLPPTTRRYCPLDDKLALNLPLLFPTLINLLLLIGVKAGVISRK